MLLMLVPHLLISVCDSRPATSQHHSDVINPSHAADDNVDDDDDADPNVFAVFQRNDPVSGKMTSS